MNHENDQMLLHGTPECDAYEARMGVRWVASRSKYHATIILDGKKIDLGYFDEFFDAICARKIAEAEHEPDNAQEILRSAGENMLKQAEELERYVEERNAKKGVILTSANKE